MRRWVLMAAVACLGAKGSCASLASAVRGIGELAGAVAGLNAGIRDRAVAERARLAAEESLIRQKLARLQARERELMSGSSAGSSGDPLPEGPPPVAALFEVGTSTSVEPALARALTELLHLRLAAEGHFRLLPLGQVRGALVEAQALSFSACVEEGCQIELGRALAAEKALIPSLLEGDDGCLLALTVYDLAKEVAEGARSVRVTCDAPSLRRGALRLAQELGAAASGPRPSGVHHRPHPGTP